MNGKIFFVIGALSGFLGVAAGAFGAHGLKSRLSPEMRTIFETGARYQLIHAVTLLAVAWAIVQFRPGPAILAGCFFTLGTILFSGSLYILSSSGIKAWGAVTPLGGLFLLAGWISLAVSALRS